MCYLCELPLLKTGVGTRVRARDKETSVYRSSSTPWKSSSEKTVCADDSMAPRYFNICANNSSHSAISRIGTAVSPSITLPLPFASVRT